MATTSPGLTPAAVRPRATASTVSPYSAKLRRRPLEASTSAVLLLLRRQESSTRSCRKRPFGSAYSSVRSIRLLHTLFRIPRALQFAHIHDLADMIGVVRGNIGNRRRDGGKLLFVGRFHQLLQISHHLVELLNDISPLLIVEIVEG